MLPIIGLVSLHLQTRWLAPGFTSRSPQGSDRLAALFPRPRQEGQPSGEGGGEGMVVVVVVVVAVAVVVLVVVVVVVVVVVRTSV